MQPISDRGAGLKFDGGKPQPGLLIDGVPRALSRVADVLTFGAKKYKAHSWKQVENGQERYNDAKVRHQLAAGRGEVYDPESGIEHLAHEACNILFLLELMLEQKEKYGSDIQTDCAADLRRRIDDGKQRVIQEAEQRQMSLPFASGYGSREGVNAYLAERYKDLPFRDADITAKLAGYRDPLGYPEPPEEGCETPTGCGCN